MFAWQKMFGSLGLNVLTRRENERGRNGGVGDEKEEREFLTSSRGVLHSREEGGKRRESSFTAAGGQMDLNTSLLFYTSASLPDI